MLRFSRMLDLGSPMPDFSLTDTDGKVWTSKDFQDGNGAVVAFICNHCPFVLHIVDAFSAFAKECQAKGIKVVAISSNDPTEFPEDDFEHMKTFAKAHHFSFPYLFDESQAVALAFNAICTPDFFVFNKDGRLYYTGEFD